MPYSDNAAALRTPPLTALPRLEDRIPFLSVDRMRIEQTRTGIEGHLLDESGAHLRVPIPFASVAALILGPGCSITSPAMSTLHRHGTVLVFGSADGVTGYATARPLSSSSEWAIAQGRTATDQSLRITAARRLYAERFAGCRLPDNVTIQQLRGLEGRLIRQAYLAEARNAGIPRFHRDTKAADPVNIALNATNAILYGIALSVTSALALNPALGIIHSGASGAFLYDLADAYKTITTIPSAFAASRSPDPIRDAARRTRDCVRDHDIANRMFALAKAILEPARSAGSGIDKLFDPEGDVAGHTNWAPE